MDAVLQGKVEEWKQAKQVKDFVTADRLRDEIRNAGFDPDMKKKDKDDPEIQMKIQMWMEAKQQKDFGTADAIRFELRGLGIEPDPKGGVSQFQPQQQQQQGMGGGQGMQGGMQGGNMPGLQGAMALHQQAQASSQAPPLTPDLQQEVSSWFAARKQQNWGVADAIRDGLRAQGIEPMNYHTPGGRGKGGGGGGFQQQQGGFQQQQGGFQQQQGNFSSQNSFIQQQMQSMGIQQQQPQGNFQQQQQPQNNTAGMDPQTQADLLQWFEAREAQNFDVADKIREHLRSQGIEPSHCQRPMGSGGFGKAAGKGAQRGGAPYGSVSQLLNAGGGGGGGQSGSFDEATEAQLDEWWQAKQEYNFNAADAIRNDLRTQGIEPDQHRPKQGGGGFQQSSGLQDGGLGGQGLAWN